MNTLIRLFLRLAGGSLVLAGLAGGLMAQTVSTPSTGGIRTVAALPVSGCRVGDVVSLTTGGKGVYQATSVGPPCVWATAPPGPAGTGFSGSGTFAEMNASSPSANDVWELIDAASPGYCGAGGGTSRAICIYTGAAWVPSSGMVAGGSAGQVPYQTDAGVTGFTSGFAFNISTGLGVIQGFTAGQTGGTGGAYRINGATSGTVTIKGADEAGTWSFTVPTSGGDNGYVLTTNGSGVTSWAAPSGGMADPGSNGIVKRTALNTTGVAAASDVTGLFSGSGDYLKSDGSKGTPSGTGITVMTTGSADPVASCTAPSTSNLALYTQTTTQDVWACVATNTWKKILSTTNLGPYTLSSVSGPLSTGTAASRGACSTAGYYLATDTHALTACDGTNWSSALNPSGSVGCIFNSTAGMHQCYDASGALTTVDAASTQTLTNKTVDGVSPTTMGYLDATSSVQTQLNGKQATLSNYSTISGLTGYPAVVLTIATGTATLGTGAIAANTCASAVTVTATGTATTDVISWTPNADISGITGFGVASTDGLIIYPYPTSGNVNFKVCNSTGTSITPGSAVVLNWRISR